MNDYVERLCDSGRCSKDKCDCKDPYLAIKYPPYTGPYYPDKGLSYCGCEKYGKDTQMHPYKKGECPNFGIQEQIELKNFIDKIISVAKRDSDKRTSSIVFLKLLEEIGEYTAAKVGDKKADEKPYEELIDVIIASICLYALEGGSIEHMIEYGRLKLRKYDKKMGF